MKSQKGFTLVELMIVIAIIGLLSGIIITSLTSSKAKSRDARRVSDLNQIQLALEQYFDRCGQYPASPLGTGSACLVDNTVLLGSYISVIPRDPSTGNAYDYLPNTLDTDYILHATLESSNASVQQNSYPNTALTTFSSVNNVNAPWKSNGASPGLCYDSSVANSVLDYCISTK